MRWLSVAGTTIFLIAGAMLALRYSDDPAYTHRYRLAVEVAVDGEIRQGSSVIEVAVGEDSIPGRGRILTPKVRGEAVFVDLGEGRNVVALLSFPPRSGGLPPIEPYMLARAAFDPPPHTNGIESYQKLATMRGRTDLAGALMPRLVKFADTADPMVVHEIEAGKLQAHFGERIRLERVSIELTSDEPTSGIERRLPWIAHPERYRTDPRNPATWKPKVRLDELKR